MISIKPNCSWNDASGQDERHIVGMVNKWRVSSWYFSEFEICRLVWSVRQHDFKKLINVGYIHFDENYNRTSGVDVSLNNTLLPFEGDRWACHFGANCKWEKQLFQIWNIWSIVNGQETFIQTHFHTQFFLLFVNRNANELLPLLFHYFCKFGCMIQSFLIWRCIVYTIFLRSSSVTLNEGRRLCLITFVAGILRADSSFNLRRMRLSHGCSTFLLAALLFPLYQWPVGTSRHEPKPKSMTQRILNRQDLLKEEKIENESPLNRMFLLFRSMYTLMSHWPNEILDAEYIVAQHSWTILFHLASIECI